MGCRGLAAKGPESGDSEFAPHTRGSPSSPVRLGRAVFLGVAGAKSSFEFGLFSAAEV